MPTTDSPTSQNNCPFNGELFKTEKEIYGIRTNNGIERKTRTHFDLCPECCGVENACKSRMSDMSRDSEANPSGVSP
jgi:hypothetical protein